MGSPAAANSIEVRIAEISQLFDSLDPFPFREKDLDKEAEEFIVNWARELPVDQPIKIVVHLPDAQASTPEAQELGAALRRYFDYRAGGIGLDLNELFRVGRRALVIGVTVLSFSVIAGQTVAANVSPHPIGRVVERVCSFSDGSRTGARSKYFFTFGGRSFAGAIFISDLRGHRWN